MKILRQLNYPVLAFFLVVLAGWGFCFYCGDWWWLAGAIVVGIIAGDFVQALVTRPAPEKAKGGKRQKNSKL